MNYAYLSILVVATLAFGSACSSKRSEDVKGGTTPQTPATSSAKPELNANPLAIKPEYLTPMLYEAAASIRSGFYSPDSYDNRGVDIEDLGYAENMKLRRALERCVLVQEQFGKLLFIQNVWKKSLESTSSEEGNPNPLKNPYYRSLYSINYDLTQVCYDIRAMDYNAPIGEHRKHVEKVIEKFLDPESRSYIDKANLLKGIAHSLQKDSLPLANQYITNENLAEFLDNVQSDISTRFTSLLNSPIATVENAEKQVLAFYVQCSITQVYAGKMKAYAEVIRSASLAFPEDPRVTAIGSTHAADALDGIAVNLSNACYEDLFSGVKINSIKVLTDYADYLTNKWISSVAEKVQRENSEIHKLSSILKAKKAQ